MDSKCGRSAMKRPHWKRFELAEPHFRPNMQRNFLFRAILTYLDGNGILNPCKCYCYVEGSLALLSGKMCYVEGSLALLLGKMCHTPKANK